MKVAPKKGDRVRTRFGTGTIVYDYWAHRDRFTIEYDDGSETDHGRDSFEILPPVSGASGVEG